jgi:hypothetical protein
MARNLTWVFVKRLMRFVRVDGKTSTDGIRKALGIFDGTANILRLTMGISYGTRNGRQDKQDGALVPTFTRICF